MSKNNVSNNDDILMTVIIMHVVVMIRIIITRRKRTIIIRRIMIRIILKSYKKPHQGDPTNFMALFLLSARWSLRRYEEP